MFYDKNLLLVREHFPLEQRLDMVHSGEPEFAPIQDSPLPLHCVEDTLLPGLLQDGLNTSAELFVARPVLSLVLLTAVHNKPAARASSHLQAHTLAQVAHCRVKHVCSHFRFPDLIPESSLKI
jgi:hypothetical protein